MSKSPRCPWLNKPCIEHDCMMWTHVTMAHNPQTGASVDQWGCAFAWVPILIIETANQSRHTSASVDSMRNEIVKRMDNAPPMHATPAIADRSIGPLLSDDADMQG